MTSVVHLFSPCFFFLFQVVVTDKLWLFFPPCSMGIMRLWKLCTVYCRAAVEVKGSGRVGSGRIRLASAWIEMDRAKLSYVYYVAGGCEGWNVCVAARQHSLRLSCSLSSWCQGQAAVGLEVFGVCGAIGGSVSFPILECLGNVTGTSAVPRFPTPLLFLEAREDFWYLPPAPAPPGRRGHGPHSTRSTRPPFFSTHEFIGALFSSRRCPYV